MRFASLGSGSRGNALIIEAGATRLMLDCGFGPRETIAKLGRLGLSPEDLSGILVTHEHSDHIAGAFKLASRYRLSVWMTHGTLAAAPRGCSEIPGTELIDSHQAVQIGDLEIHPFPVPHDAREPVQFVFSAAGRRLGMLTDCGRITPHVVDVLSPCDALVLEFNHDRERLAVSSYPPSLRARIAGGYGHLENAQALSLLQTLDVGRLQHLVAAHLSEENNCPRAVEALLASLFAGDRRRFDIADQADGHGWRTLT